ncbi:CLUMA_CG001766, isoform A [Clunio marinus]|uniref:CLUMA_CG001766, isoform A n=1 Tax=Clunio marinus TaxID=568069 RepID=A0A1J1HKP2_9DIPT|nr:CLUMA_CG001766, isoform A [Clunio marinus]
MFQIGKENLILTWNMKLFHLSEVSKVSLKLLKDVEALEGISSHGNVLISFFTRIIYTNALMC